jgi:hypothetical protein
MKLSTNIFWQDKFNGLFCTILVKQAKLGSQKFCLVRSGPGLKAISGSNGRDVLSERLGRSICAVRSLTRTQSYDRELQHQPCKHLHTYNATNSIARILNKNYFSPM